MSDKYNCKDYEVPVGENYVSSDQQKCKYGCKDHRKEDSSVHLFLRNSVSYTANCLYDISGGTEFLSKCSDMYVYCSAFPVK